MARIDEEQIIIRFSKLIRDDEDPLAKDVINETLRTNVETFVQNLVTDDILVEANISSILSGVPYNVSFEDIPDFYQLSANAGTVTEGQQIQVSISADSSVTAGNVVEYTITGVTSDDISGASLTGSFTVSGGGTTTQSFTTVDSGGANGQLVFTLVLDYGQDDNISIIINSSV